MRRLLLAYQIIVASADTFTGAGLMLAPAFTLRLMGVNLAPTEDIWIGYIGSFVFGVGLLCTCGALILLRQGKRAHMEMLWLATAILRISVALYVTLQLLSAQLTLPWLQVAVFDATCAAVQLIGLRRRWLNHALG